MAVLEISLLWTGRGGKDDIDHHRTYTRTYEVLVDDPDDDEQVVGNASIIGGLSIPQRGESFDRDERAVVSHVSAIQSDDDWHIWHVEVEYDTDPKSSNKDKPDNHVDLDGNTIDKQRQENPLLEPATWTLTFRDSDEPAIEGIPVNDDGTPAVTVPVAWAANTKYKRGVYIKNGLNVYLCVSAGTSSNAGGATGPVGLANGQADGTVVWNYYATFAQTQNDPLYVIRSAILNSAWLPFDPPATVQVGHIVLSVTKNMPIATLEYLLTLKNGLNLFPWRGVPSRCAKVQDVTHDGGKEKNGIGYVTTKWEIVLDGDTFDIRLLDSGFYERITYTHPVTLQQVTDYSLIKDANGDPITQPALLDGSGHRLKPDDPPVFKRYIPRQNRLIDFNTVLPF